MVFIFMFYLVYSLWFPVSLSLKIGKDLPLMQQIFPQNNGTALEKPLTTCALPLQVHSFFMHENSY